MHLQSRQYYDDGYVLRDSSPSSSLSSLSSFVVSGGANSLVACHKRRSSTIILGKASLVDQRIGLVKAGVFATDDVTTLLRPDCRRISRHLYTRGPYNNTSPSSFFPLVCNFNHFNFTSCAFPPLHLRIIINRYLRHEHTNNRILIRNV
jgi:hypothetical protein